MKVTSKLLNELINWMLSFNTIVKKMRLNGQELQEETLVDSHRWETDSFKDQRLFFLKANVRIWALLANVPAIHNQSFF